MKGFLFNPVVSDKKKRDLLSTLANDAGLSKHTLNFLNLLLDQDRLVAIQEIFDQFEIQYCKLTDTQASTALEMHTDGCSLLPTVLLASAARNCPICKIYQHNVGPLKYTAFPSLHLTTKIHMNITIHIIPST